MPRSYRDQVGQLTELIGIGIGIGGQLFKPLRTFSGGMKRSLEIIRSLMCSPDALFLDEPTSGLEFFAVFVLVGTFFFARNERNR
ncbi:ATP-binding cassette domain-containing protein [Actinomadura meridiana]